MLNIDTSIDLKQCLLWQYNNSTTLKSLVQAKQDWYKENQEKFWNDWYTNIFNIDTANAFGLNVWGEILNFPRMVKAKDEELHYLTDKQYRLILKGQMIKFGMGASAYDVNKWLQLVFKDYGQVYCVDKGNMEAVPFVFRAIPSQEILWLLSNVDFVPRPAGVGYEIHIIPNTTFGFNGSGLRPFNQGVFNNDYSEEITPTPEGTFQLQINVPQGANVKINGQLAEYLLLEDRTYFQWEVYQDGFKSLTGEGVINGEDIIIDVAKFELQYRDGATSYINNENAKGVFFLAGHEQNYNYSIGYPNYISLNGNNKVYQNTIIETSYFNVNVPSGASSDVNETEGAKGFIFLKGQDISYHYRVYRNNYISADGFGTINDSKNIEIATLTYNVNPSNAIVKLNATDANSAYFENGKSFTYNYVASLTGYKTITKTGTIDKSTVIDINMELVYNIDEVVFESSTAGTYNKEILADGLYEFTCIGAGGGDGLYVFNHHYGNSTRLYGAVATGGAGGYVKGTFRISAQTLPITVGNAGSSYIYNYFNTGSSFPSSSVVAYKTGSNGTASIIGGYITANGGTGGTAGVRSYNTSSYVPTFNISVGSGGTTTHSGSTSITTNRTGDNGNTNSQYNLGTGTSSILVSANGGNSGNSNYGYSPYCEVSTSKTATKNSYKWNATGKGYVKIVFKGL